MARPLRFRYAPGQWSLEKVRTQLYEDLDRNLGATIGSPWYLEPEGFEARRFEMENGDTALFCWNDEGGYWIGNTETPSALWQTDKCDFDEIPESVSKWADRELLAQLYEETPWLKEYPTLASFFLPVLLSKDGRHTTREFLSTHAAGFPETPRNEALQFYDHFLKSGALDAYRYVMASKLGTSESFDLLRMRASMGEFNAAILLHEAGYDLTPEIEVTTGHSIDFRADPGGTLIEVTRPSPPRNRKVNSPVTAVRQTTETKTEGQLANHGGGVVLFVDCSSFPAETWEKVRTEEPSVGHRPAVVFWMRPDGITEGYQDGSVPLDLSGVL